VPCLDSRLACGPPPPVMNDRAEGEDLAVTCIGRWCGGCDHFADTASRLSRLFYCCQKLHPQVTLFVGVLKVACLSPGF
jgi:hypothetical protein